MVRKWHTDQPQRSIVQFQRNEWLDELRAEWRRDLYPGLYEFFRKRCRTAIPAVHGMVHLAWTQDSASHTARLYVNGILAGQNAAFTLTPSGIGATVANYIGGNGSPSTTSNFQGRILEFRVYQGALSPLDAAVLDAFGPGRPQLNPGTLQAVRLVIPSPTGPGALFRAGVYADFANVSNVNISTQPDRVLLSDNANAIAIASDKRLGTVALGTANITAVWQGFSNTVTVTVGAPRDVALIHRYSFNEQTNDWIVHDSVGPADGRLIGDPVTISFIGTGKLKLVGYPNGSGAYVALPTGLISDLSEVSVETWITWTPGNARLGYGTGGWQRIFDFGSQQNGDGYGSDVRYLFLTPATDNVSFNTIGKSVLHATITLNSIYGETPRLDWTNHLATNVESFVAITYSPFRRIMKMYLNGVPVAGGNATLPLSGIIDTNNWLGRSQYAADPYFSGFYNEFRIYRGLLSDADVAADYAAGPDVVGVDYVLHEFPSGNSLTITWGTTATNWLLESSPTLGSGATWTPVSNRPLLQNGRYNVTVPISSDASYFRLHAPL